VGIYVLIRIIFAIFGYEFAFSQMHLGDVFMTVSLVAIFASSLVAIYQKDIKRMLAYSSVAQIGYIILGLSLQNETGNSAAIIHLFNHAAAKVTLFMAVGCVVYKAGSANIENFYGIASKMPITLAAFINAGLSMIGIPLTGGFISKWFLLDALAQAKLWPVFAAVIISSILAMFYILRVVDVAYNKESNAGTKEVTEAPVLMVLPTVLMAAITLIFGIYSEPMTSFATRISAYLFSL
jgi:multicomponent Na+:H+ antiporter subunit D